MNTFYFTFRKVVFITAIVLKRILCCSPEQSISYIENVSWQTRILERYLEIESVSLLRCAKECMVRKRCQSFNYDRFMNYCELSYVEKKIGTRDESNIGLGFIHSDIRHFDKNLIGRCKNHSCNLSSKCNIATGSCDVSDCGQAKSLLNTTILSYGHHEINNGVFYGCLPQFSMIDTNGKPTTNGLLRCKSDGEWAEPDFLCIPHCPDKWTDTFKGKEYCFVLNELKSWTDAQERCREMNKNLMTLHSLDEMKWVVDTAQNKGFAKVTLWTGGNDREEEGVFKWESDGSLMTDGLWAHAQPNNNHDADCVLLKHTRGTWGLNDKKCDTKERFVCKN